METRVKLPNSVRKYIRTQKAQIRRQFWDVKKQDEGIAEMYKKISQNTMGEAKVAKVVKVAKKQPTVKTKAKKEDKK